MLQRQLRLDAVLTQKAATVMMIGNTKLKEENSKLRKKKGKLEKDWKQQHRSSERSIIEIPCAENTASIEGPCAGCPVSGLGVSRARPILKGKRNQIVPGTRRWSMTTPAVLIGVHYV
jgi:hypothetical protein